MNERKTFFKSMKYYGCWLNSLPQQQLTETEIDTYKYGVIGRTKIKENYKKPDEVKKKNSQFTNKIQKE